MSHFIVEQQVPWIFYSSNYFCFNVFVYVLQSIYVRSRSTYMYVKYLSLADWSLYHPLDVCNLVCNWLICFVSSNRNRYNNQCVRLLLLLVCKWWLSTKVTSMTKLPLLVHVLMLPSLIMNLFQLYIIIFICTSKSSHSYLLNMVFIVNPY